jgi:hypothetical protein
MMNDEWAGQVKQENSSIVFVQHGYNAEECYAPEAQ